jgi:hypothetical protein
MRDNEFTRILDWPGYRVFRHEIDETAKTLRLWVRRKRWNCKLLCSGCGRKFSEAHDYYQREVRDLPWRKYRTTVIIELTGCAVRQVARQFGLAASTVRTIDLRYLERWSAMRRKDRLAQMGVDEIYIGKQMKFITVVSNLESGEPLWFGLDRVHLSQCLCKLRQSDLIFCSQLVAQFADGFALRRDVDSTT